MRAGLAFFCLLVPLSAWDDLAKPEKLSIHTWVREDIFAGFMAHDTASFERGARKIDRFLADNPGDANGLAWKYEVYVYRMRNDRETGNDSAYRQHWAEAQEYKKRSLALRDPKDVAPLLIVGSSQIWGAPYAAGVVDRESLFREGRELLRQAEAMQSEYLDQIPPHMRGEL